MKHKISKLLIVSALLTNLPACIEVKDQGDEPQAMVQTIQGGDLKIEEPLYLIEGEFLRESEIQNPEKSQSPSRDYEYNFSNLEIGPKGVLYTMGNKVRINAQNFKTWGGAIASFPEGQSSTSGNGRSGGYVVVWAQNGEGVLNIVLQGENGKNGEPGAVPSEELKGSRGNNGKDMNFCAPSAVGHKGWPGGRGLQGYKGQAGFLGGDSGAAVVTILSSVSFKLSVNIQEGKGGAGGPGGAGGEGGDPGLGGLVSACRRQPDRGETGDKGKTGPMGDSGAPGASGIKQTACLEINKLSQCEAKSFNYSR
jgi:hypothetical protein